MSFADASAFEPSSITSKAFTGMLMVLSLYFVIRSTYRTIRNTLSIISFVIRWGLLVYIIFWLWLYFTETNEHSTVHHGLAASQHLIQSATMLWHLAQRPDMWQPIVQHVTGLLRPPKPSSSKNRRTKKKRARKPEEDLAELADVLGWDEWLSSFSTPTKRTNKWNPMPRGAKAERDL